MIEREADELRDVLIRNGFVRCDIAACNCGSWHARYGLRERFDEIQQMLSDAGHPLCNENGNLVSRALAALIEERDALARSGQAASGSQENARSDVQNGVGQPEAPTAAPLTDEQATAFLLELRAVVAETMKRPGEAVPIPAMVRTEVAKFMRDQPSVFDRLPYGEVVALAEFCGGVVAHPPARSGADHAALVAECAPYLKEGETPLQRIQRDSKDMEALLTLLSREKLRSMDLAEKLAARSGAGSEEGQ